MILYSFKMFNTVMASVGSMTQENPSARVVQRDSMNNELSSTSSDDIATRADPVSQYNKYYERRYTETALSDNETLTNFKNRPNNNVVNQLPNRSHCKSMGNINDAFITESNFDTNLNRVQNSISNVDLSLHGDELKKYECLQIPIVGYEVMEERARFTIYKLKVEDEKTNQCWLVFRRYTDFVRLYTRIKTEHPNLMLPMPGKRWFRDNFEPAFLEERVRGLQKFVNAIVKRIPNHPVIREFFCLDEPPQVFSYQPEVQAVYGALEDSISTLKVQMKQKDATITHLQARVAQLEAQLNSCSSCRTMSFSS